MILVGVLGLALHRLKLANALKSALVGGHRHGHARRLRAVRRRSHWAVVAVAAPASLLGGFLGAADGHPHPRTPLRVLIVVFGVAVSIYLFLRG